jgi:ubiquitin carboxyl-terminal hydrolase 25/28
VQACLFLCHTPCSHGSIGKTAPCLAADIRSYSPHLEYLKRSQTQNTPSAWNTQAVETYNPLRDPPPGYEQPERIREKPRGGCRHLFTTKQIQSAVPPQDAVPEPGTSWKSASVCQNCRWHLDVTVHFQELENDQVVFCGPPSTEQPLHHFVHGVRLGIRSNDEGIETYWYRCTNCPTSVHIAFHPPRLSDGDRSLLTDQKRLEERFLYAKEYDEMRPGLAHQRPISVLGALATYVTHAVSGDPSKINRPIPKFNKRFMLSFGEDCDELLTRLGFTAALADDNQEVWYLPQPPDADPVVDSTSEMAYLLDVKEELLSFIRQYPESEIQNLRWFASSDLAARADKSLDRVLGASTYEKAFSKRSQFETNDDPLYAGLGALPDFSDGLVLYAFGRQTTFDQQQSPYYYDCLSTIAKKRNSEPLNIAIATMASQGFITRKDVEKAYNYFAIDPQNAPHMEDGHILGLFQSRLESVPASQEADLRQQLHIIGRARGSNMLVDAASNSKYIYFRSRCILSLVERVELLCPVAVLPLVQLVNF